MTKRDDIVTAAVDVFSRYGFRQTSMDLVARAAGVSRPALYQHFRNKQDVFAAVADRVTDLMTDAARHARDTEGTPADRVYGVLAVKLETAIGVTGAGFRQELVSEAAAMGLTSVEERLVDALVELLAGGPEPRETAALLLASTVGIGQSDGAPRVLRHRLRRLVDLVMDGLAAGFRAGNGLPYYVVGSTGESTGPGPLRPSAVANVLSRWVLLFAAAVCRHFTDSETHPLPTYAAAAAGVLLVGLIHARLWRADPWGRARKRILPEGRQA